MSKVFGVVVCLLLLSPSSSTSAQSLRERLGIGQTILSEKYPLKVVNTETGDTLVLTRNFCVAFDSYAVLRLNQSPGPQLVFRTRQLDVKLDAFVLPNLRPVIDPDGRLLCKKGRRNWIIWDSAVLDSMQLAITLPLQREKARREAERRADEQRWIAEQEAVRKARVASEKARKDQIRWRWPKQANRILSGQIEIGWTKEMVRAAWGLPDHVNKTVTRFGTSEQWVYGTCRYAYFDDGILTTIQTCE